MDNQNRDPNVGGGGQRQGGNDEPGGKPQPDKSKEGSQGGSQAGKKRCIHVQ